MFPLHQHIEMAGTRPAKTIRILHQNPNFDKYRLSGFHLFSAGEINCPLVHLTDEVK